ncbi:MAG: hypothetical protein A2V90_05765 [Gammaproteobacteria bacterium RBG_16_57_12]|nr:MAG: hypothetical protein A2V90_05765 [Gammaproteobacteria bacterium RBG_16_57_12]
MVMIHGVASNLTRWSEFVEQTHLAGSWGLVRIDLRGHGTSPYRGKLTHEVWADDVHAILAQEGFRRAVIVGHSLGAQVGLHFATRYPQETAGLVLLDPVFPECLRGRLATARRIRPLIGGLIRLAWFLNALGMYRRHFPSLDLKTLDLQTRELLKADDQIAIAKRYARPGEDIKYLPLANYLQDLYEVTRPLPPLADIPMPVLVIMSSGVGITSLEMNRRRVDELPDAKIVIIDADHWLLTERPLEVRQAIEDWCQSLKSDGSHR